MQPEPHPERPNEAGDRSIVTLFRQLSRELGTLLRQEADLARAEVREKAAHFGTGVSQLGAGAGVVFAGFLILLMAAVYGLAGLVDSLALAALIVGAITTAIGLVLLVRGRSQLKSETLTPTRTVESLRQDVQMVQGDGPIEAEATHLHDDAQHRSH